MSVVRLRPAVVGDSEFCFQLHKAAMRDYVDAIWGWEDQPQRDYHDASFDPSRWQIITADDENVGMIEVERGHDAIYLARIEILPSHQGLGIGTSLISSLIEEAESEGKELALDVLVVNSRALALYRRLGLTEVGRHGENKIKISMRTRPPHDGAF